MNTKTLTSAIAIFAALAISDARAADIYSGGGLKDGPGYDRSAPTRAYNWTGIYIGGQIGYGNSNHNLKENDTVSDCGSHNVVARDGNCYSKKDVTEDENGVVTPKTDATPIADATITTTSYYSSFLDGLNSSGIFGGGTIGADYQMGRFVVGGFFDYNISNADFTTGTRYGVCPACDTSSASIEDGDSWLIAARAGILFGEEKRALLYVLGGYGQQDVVFKGFFDKNKDVTFSGFVAGAGSEYALNENVSIGIEYQHFFGSEETLFDSGFLGCEAERSKLTDDMSSDKIMAKMRVKLNGPILGN